MLQISITEEESGKKSKERSYVYSSSLSLDYAVQQDSGCIDRCVAELVNEFIV